MNLKKLRNNVGQPVRLRPAAVLHSTGEERDSRWCLHSIDDVRRHVVLTRDDIPWRVELGFDQIRNFSTPDFLILHAQLVIGVPGRGWDIEPLLQTRVPQPSAEAVLERAVREALPFLPGACAEPKYVKTLSDPDRRREWFASQRRDERGGVTLPLLSDGVRDMSVVINIPLKHLQAARRDLEDEARARLFHPLDD